MLHESSHNIFSFELGPTDDLIEKIWTTNDIFKNFNISLDSEIANTRQLVATVWIVKNNQETKNILNEFLDTVSNNYELITDIIKNPQHPEFKENRHDQSIFSIVRKLRGTISIPDETFYNNGVYCRSNYLIYMQDKPFWATRIRGNEIMGIDKCTFLKEN